MKKQQIIGTISLIYSYFFRYLLFFISSCNLSSPWLPSIKLRYWFPKKERKRTKSINLHLFHSNLDFSQTLGLSQCDIFQKTTQNKHTSRRSISLKSQPHPFTGCAWWALFSCPSHIPAPQHKTQQFITIPPHKSAPKRAANLRHAAFP